MTKFSKSEITSSSRCYTTVFTVNLTIKRSDLRKEFYELQKSKVNDILAKNEILKFHELQMINSRIVSHFIKTSPFAKFLPFPRHCQQRNYMLVADRLIQRTWSSKVGVTSRFVTLKIRYQKRSKPTKEICATCNLLIR